MYGFQNFWSVFFFKKKILEFPSENESSYKNYWLVHVWMHNLYHKRIQLCYGIASTVNCTFLLWSFGFNDFYLFKMQVANFAVMTSITFKLMLLRLTTLRTKFMMVQPHFIFKFSSSTGMERLNDLVWFEQTFINYMVFFLKSIQIRAGFNPFLEYLSNGFVFINNNIAQYKQLFKYGMIRSGIF